MVVELVSDSPERTREIGRRVGARLAAGSVLLLEGELGSGKTTFVQGLSAACGVTSGVKSPTYALMHRYRGRPDVIHVDLYRERDARGLEDFDWEAGGGDAVTVVEWPEGLSAYLWPDAPRVRFEHLDSRRRRILVPEGLWEAEEEDRTGPAPGRFRGGADA